MKPNEGVLFDFLTSGLIVNKILIIFIYERLFYYIENLFVRLQGLRGGVLFNKDIYFCWCKNFRCSLIDVLEYMTSLKTSFIIHKMQYCKFGAQRYRDFSQNVDGYFTIFFVLHILFMLHPVGFLFGTISIIYSYEKYTVSIILICKFVI